MRVMFVEPKWGYELGFNLGLAYVLSATEKRHKVSLLDMTFESGLNQKYILEKVEIEKPDLVAFSIVTSSNLNNALKIAELIRKIKLKIPFIFGGILPTLYPEAIIKHPLVDGICIGEGEVSFVEFLDNIEQGKELLVEGIWYKDKKGKIIKNNLRPLIENLDELPFPNWDYWDLEKYFKAGKFLMGGLAFSASRGCPYNCSFCSEPLLRKAVPGKIYRLRKAKNIIAEIKLNLQKYWDRGFRNIDYYDSTFGLDLQQLRDFCALFKGEGLNKKLTWECETRPDLVTKEWADIAGKANCVRVAIGIESGDDRIRNQIYDKGVSREQIAEAMKNLVDNHIMISCHIMFDPINDDELTVKRSLDLVYKWKPSFWRVSVCSPLPGTKLSGKIFNKQQELEKNIYSKNESYLSNSSIKILNKLMIHLRLYTFCILIKNGFRLKRSGFILDSFRYIFSIGRSRVIPLMKPINFGILMQRTVYQYIIREIEEKRSRTV